MKAKHRLFFQSMFREHNANLLRFLGTRLADPEEAEDIAQDAYHNLLRSAEPDKLDNAKAYLFQTAANLALNRLRKQRRSKRYEQSLSLDKGENAGTVPLERAVCAQYELEKVLEAVNQLPEKCRRAFILSRAKGRSYQEISDEIGVSVSTVEKYLIRALDHLRKQLQG